MKAARPLSPAASFRGLEPHLAEREGFEPSCAWAQTDSESAPLWPLRYLSIIVMHKCASQLWSLMRWGSMSLLIESTSHSQLGGRGACSPDEELANHRHRRYISPWCILYIFDCVWISHGFCKAMARFASCLAKQKGCDPVIIAQSFPFCKSFFEKCAGKCSAGA